MNANGNKMQAMFSIPVATVAMVLVCTLSASREPSSNTVLLDLVAFWTISRSSWLCRFADPFPWCLESVQLLALFEAMANLSHEWTLSHREFLYFRNRRTGWVSFVKQKSAICCRWCINLVVVVVCTILQTKGYRIAMALKLFITNSF